MLSSWGVGKLYAAFQRHFVAFRDSASLCIAFEWYFGVWDGLCGLGALFSHQSPGVRPPTVVLMLPGLLPPARLRVSITPHQLVLFLAAHRALQARGVQEEILQGHVHVSAVHVPCAHRHAGAPVLHDPCGTEVWLSGRRLLGQARHCAAAVPELVDAHQIARWTCQSLAWLCACFAASALLPIRVMLDCVSFPAVSC